MARALADAGVGAIYSYAGRTEAPVAQPVPVRVGGFGGVQGLAHWIADNGITCVIDATHPFAVQISRNAVAATAIAGVELIALERPQWAAQKGDRWRCVADFEGAAAALPSRPTDVFLAIGRQNLKPFAAKTHRYVVRLVDDVLPFPDLKATALIDRGPFSVESELRILRHLGFTHVVAKNSGGAGAEAKLIAARMLGVTVILVDRPEKPFRRAFRTPADVLRFMHHADLGV